MCLILQSNDLGGSQLQNVQSQKKDLNIRQLQNYYVQSSLHYSDKNQGFQQNRTYIMP